MTSTAILTDETATIVADDRGRHFNWGAAIAGAVAATAVTLILLTLGSGVGLGLMSVQRGDSATTFFSLGAIWVFASQAFGFTVGGYLVGRLIGPRWESAKEEEFRAAAHGLVMWGVAVVASLVIAGFASVLAGSALTAGMAAVRTE